MNKKFIVINIFLTFAMGFLIHGIYSWLPSPITSIFPVNESLYEHVKLIFYSPLISSLILYYIFKRKGHIINNYLFGYFVSTIFNIFLFYLIFIPVYREIGENLLVTLIIYFMTICISGYLYYLIINSKNSNKQLHLISLILVIISVITLTYFTYYPMRNEFFRDPRTNIYGIKK